MLKKLIIVSSAAAVLGMGFVGVASAHEGHNGAGETTCTSNDTQKQSNKGHQLVGGNLAAQDAETNVLGAQATRPAGICPSIGNNNHL
ncbi:hypothetical protein [Pseudonocardia spinosispora]|uniref:hypothetical protein n=1 Tax=Pseudonocardia spinosispora TaxID=103441 RepID=UPI00040047E0|nr:hypothetical protein [Pseudonocardia spinosispora]